MDKTANRLERATGKLITGHFREHDAYRTIRTEGRSDWLALFTLHGRGFFQQPDILLEVGPGDLVILEPHAYQDYGCLPAQTWNFQWAHFMARTPWLEYLKLPEQGKGLRKETIPDKATRNRIRSAFQRCILDVRADPDGLGEELGLNALEEVFLLVSRERRIAQRPRPLSLEVRRVTDLLSTSFQKPQNVPDLARVARLSPSRFAHRFKEELGESVIAHLNRIRMREAARLLEYSGQSIQEVARAVGFECPFYFSRTFRKAYQQSPRAYRKRYRAAGS